MGVPINHKKWHDIQQWAKNYNDRLFWLEGMPGAGKSNLVQYFLDQGKLAVSSLFIRDERERGSASRFLGTTSTDLVTYEHNHQNGHIPSYHTPRAVRRDMKIWDTARATSAATTFLDSVHISNGKGLVDGGIGATNSFDRVWTEAPRENRASASGGTDGNRCETRVLLGPNDGYFIPFLRLRDFFLTSPQLTECHYTYQDIKCGNCKAETQDYPAYADSTHTSYGNVFTGDGYDNTYEYAAPTEGEARCINFNDPSQMEHDSASLIDSSSQVSCRELVTLVMSPFDVSCARHIARAMSIAKIGLILVLFVSGFYLNRYAHEGSRESMVWSRDPRVQGHNASLASVLGSAFIFDRSKSLNMYTKEKSYHCSPLLLNASSVDFDHLIPRLHTQQPQDATLSTLTRKQPTLGNLIVACIGQNGTATQTLQITLIPDQKSMKFYTVMGFILSSAISAAGLHKMYPYLLNQISIFTAVFQAAIIGCSIGGDLEFSLLTVLPWCIAGPVLVKYIIGDCKVYTRSFEKW
ncbi:Nn.00g076240.m01.CDS01 [Neocucurbitaria sp. VM-36]